MDKLEKIIASILFIIMQANGFFFAYALLLGAIRIDLPNITIYLIVVAAVLSTLGMFAYFLKKGD